MTVYFTAAEVAARWRCSRDEVYHQLRAGNLRHIKLDPKAVRPTYRISEKHLRDFERQRESAA